MRAAAVRGEFLPVNCLPGETYLEGDPIMKHQRPGRIWFLYTAPQAAASARNSG